VTNVVELRRIADALEKGEYGLMTSAVLVLGHTNQKVLDDGQVEHTIESHTFSAGPRDDLFTVKGLLLTGLGDLA